MHNVSSHQIFDLYSEIYWIPKELWKPSRILITKLTACKQDECDTLEDGWRKIRSFCCWETYKATKEMKYKTIKTTGWKIGFSPSPNYKYMESVWLSWHIWKIQSISFTLLKAQLYGRVSVHLLDPWPLFTLPMPFKNHQNKRWDKGLWINKVWLKRNVHY